MKRQVIEQEEGLQDKVQDSSKEKKREVWSVEIKRNILDLELDHEDMFRIINALANLQAHLASSNLEAVRDRAREYNILVWDLDKLYCMMRSLPEGAVIAMHVKSEAQKRYENVTPTDRSVSE